MAARDLLHDGEPEPGARDRAGGQRPVEAVEDVRLVSGIDAWAVVAHGELAAGQPHLHRPSWRAELRGVVEQVPDRHAQPVGAAVDDAAVQVGAERGLRPVPARRLQGGGGHLVQPDRFAADRGRLAPGQLGDAGDELAELGDLIDDPGQHLLALGGGHVRVVGEQVDVDTQAREGGAQLVAGVADQAPLRGQRPLERAQHAVERRGEPARAVPAAHLDPPAWVPGRGHLLGDAGQPGHRREPRPGHRPAQHGRGHDADDAEDGQRGPDAGHLQVGRAERLGHLEGEPRRELDGVHRGAHPADPGVKVERGLAARRHPHGPGTRGEQAHVAGRRPGPARRGDHLGVRRGDAEAVRVRRDPAVGNVPVVLPRWAF